LAGIQHKLSRKLPLTPNEENLLAECQRVNRLKPKEETVFDADGKIHFKRSVDAEPIMEAMKDYGDIIQKHKSKVAGAQMLGSIDPITAAIWRKECGAGIGTREFAIYAKKKLASSDWKRFRIGGA
jgi:hypothetical protein